MCLAYGLEKVTIHNTAFMLLQNLHLLKRTFHFISKRSFQSHFKRSFQNFIFQIYFWQNIEVGGGGSGNTKRLDLIKMLISKFLCIHHVNQTAFIVKKSNSFILNMPLLLPPTKKREGEKKKKKKETPLLQAQEITCYVESHHSPMQTLQDNLLSRPLLWKFVTVHCLGEKNVLTPNESPWH